jgi:hypothetical protein
MFSYAEKAYGEGFDIQAMIYDPAKRETLLKALEKSGKNLIISWRIGTRISSSIGTERSLNSSFITVRRITWSSRKKWKRR